MSERVSSSSASNPSYEPNTPTPVTSQSSPVIDEAAAEFESLLSNDQTREPNQPTDYRQDDRGGSSSSDQHDSDNAGSRDDQRSDKSTSQESEKSSSNAKQEDGHSGDKKGGLTETDGNALQTGEQAISPGDAILQSLGKPETAVAGPQHAAAAEGAQGPAQLDQVVQQVADRILVSPPGQTGTAPEVRITLKESAMPGTEIRITQEAGRLQVSFVTTDAKSHDFLAQNHGQLQKQLGDRLPEHSLVVEVEMESQADTGDGRSRQRRDLKEEAEEAADD